MNETGGGEVSESTEVSEAPAEMTGGEASEATQEAAVEEADETGGFDDPETAGTTDAGLDEEDPEEEIEDPEADGTGFEEGEGVEGVEDADGSLEELDEMDDETVSDEDGVGFEDSEEQWDDTEAEEPEDSSDGDRDEMQEDTAADDMDDAADGDPDALETDEAELLDEEPDVDSGEPEDYSDETAEENADTDEVGEDTAEEAESEQDDAEEGDTADTEDIYDEDIDEDPGEEEDYSDEAAEENADTDEVGKDTAEEAEPEQNETEEEDTVDTGDFYDEDTDEDPGEEEVYSEEETEDPDAGTEDTSEQSGDNSVRDLDESKEASEDLPPETADGDAGTEDGKAEVSEATRQSLENFEQSKWDELSQAEKEQAAEQLRDSVAEDLQLEDRPDVAYYDNPDPGDFGGYAASNNTIYINRFNMGDAAETADTIAHESRHCWQHEREEDPQTEQDYQFKENFDDYVKPEENYELYLDQPVERDAREYADQVKSQIGAGDGPQEALTDTEETAKDNIETNEGSRAPPEAGESRTVTELPSDLESKNVRAEQTAECYRKYGEIVRDTYENSNGSVIEKSNGETYKELDPDERQQLADKGKELINSIPEEERGDFRVPDADKIKGVRENARLEENWKDGTDGAEPGSRHMETPVRGEIIDRIGDPGGNYFAAMKEDGTPYSLKERAIGDYLPSEDVTKNASYHSYEVQKDFTKENFEQALKDRYEVTDDMPYERTPQEYQKLKEQLDEYYEDCADDTAQSSGHEGEKYADTAGSAEGVKTSRIDSMFTPDDGGGKQYITPFSAQTLMDLGMIEERGN